MKYIFHIRTLITAALILSLPLFSIAQPTNDNCSGVTTITPTSSCSYTTYNIKNATNAAPTGACGGATATTTYDMWFRFQATSTTHAITLANYGSNLTAASTYIQVLSGAACAGYTSLACQAASSRMVVTGLTVGTFYYLRIYVTSNPNGSGNANKYDYDMCLQGPPANDNCAGATSLTSNTSCSNITSTIDLASSTTGLPAGCEAAGTHYDVWFSFQALNTSSTVSISSLGSNFTNPEVQIYSGACGSLTSLQCGTTSATATGLTIGNTYYARVSNIGSLPTSNNGFDICVTHPTPPPANDDCAGAISLTPGTSCSNTTGTLIAATATTGIPAGCASGSTHYDVWYKFVAASTYELVSLSGLGSNFTNPEIQVYSGSCGSLTSLQCGTTSLAVTGLTIGNTYYVRVSNLTTAIATNGGFSICVYHPTAATYDYGKSYVNITRNSGGGTINPGDTLEIRATLVVRSLSLDSLAFFDTLRNNGGLRLIPSTITLRTNEGKVYKSFTDAADTDAGWFYTNGLDTVIRINMGANASGTARGKLFNTSKPSVFGSTCIIMATYRVVVYGSYGSTLNMGGGGFTTRDPATTISRTLGMSQRNAYVYSSPGLCPNAVSATNAIGGDTNGTFGAPAGGAPLAKNRIASSNVPGYIYATFSTGAPQDYYYGITNNTSGSGSSFTILNTWAKPDNSSPTHRVFNVWDIIGDHSGATNTAKGNPPCDTTKPISTTNPCGYMLVINSAYKTDTAFQYSVTNLCPNTYYEISAWIRNICYKCSCDSNGTGASGAGYIPFATGDSSGVQPNLAFDIDGIDYYTTGNIVYSGIAPTTQAGSDSTNKWVKRGFVYLTGTSQTSLTLSIRNNAPGGGGNDWALDDITLATCLPNMKYSPSLNPTICDSNSVTINDTIQSYFDNYSYYKWQRSTNGGASWTDVTAAMGPVTPTWNGSSWQYITSYTVPPTATYLSNNGDLYRVVVATTNANLGNANCQVTDGVSIISLNVIDCDIALNLKLLSFNGHLDGDRSNLFWTTTDEDESVQFEIERSDNGISFYPIGRVNSYNNYGSVINHYSFVDPMPVTKKAWYRVITINNAGGKRYTRIIQLNGQNAFALSNIVNPFDNELSFEITSPVDSKLDIVLIDILGKPVRTKSFLVFTGVNSLRLDDTQNLPRGNYILRVSSKDAVTSRKVLKN